MHLITCLGFNVQDHIHDTIQTNMTINLNRPQGDINKCIDALDSTPKIYLLLLIRIILNIF